MDPRARTRRADAADHQPECWRAARGIDGGCPVDRLGTFAGQVALRNAQRPVRLDRPACYGVSSAKAVIAPASWRRNPAGPRNSDTQTRARPLVPVANLAGSDLAGEDQQLSLWIIDVVLEEVGAKFI